jgi:hypothetical protein
LAAAAAAARRPGTRAPKRIFVVVVVVVVLVSLSFWFGEEKAKGRQKGMWDLGQRARLRPLGQQGGGGVYMILCCKGLERGSTERKGSVGLVGEKGTFLFCAHTAKPPLEAARVYTQSTPRGGWVGGKYIATKVVKERRAVCDIVGKRRVRAGGPKQRGGKQTRRQRKGGQEGKGVSNRIGWGAKAIERSCVVIE